MQRSGGVTASAILVFIGSGLTLLLAGLLALAFFAVRDVPAQPPFVRYAMIGVATFEVAFAVWGILSGIGLLRLRKWARISMLVFSGILLFSTLPALLIVPLMPFPAPEGTPGNFALFMKVFLVVCYGIPAAIAGWWLYFFNKRAVKDQFRGEMAGVVSPTSAPKRPISISIIGWFMVVSGCLCTPFFFLHFPVFFLSFLLIGWRASLVMLGWCAIYVIAGVGLLRLKPWGRTISIWVFLFGFLNGAVTFLVPGSMVKLIQVITLTQTRWGLPVVTQPETLMHSSMLAGGIAGMLIVAIQLWFVVTRKAAFLPARDQPAQTL